MEKTFIRGTWLNIKSVFARKVDTSRLAMAAGDAPITRAEFDALKARVSQNEIGLSAIEIQLSALQNAPVKDHKHIPGGVA
jgi:hypothetical protein